ncbi:MAG TPA: cytochrome C [Anaerolineae bacterium]
MKANFKLPALGQSVFFAGIVLGLGAAVVQAYFNLLPPMAYGVCMVCHPKELVNWLSDHLLNTHWGYSMASIEAPILTVVGVVMGASLAALRHHEFNLRPAREPLQYFVFGFLMINFGLILGSCPIRIVLLSAYGSWMAMVGWACVVIGVGLGILAMRWNANRSV